MAGKLQERIESFAARADQLGAAERELALEAIEELKRELNAGTVRAATREPDGRWAVHEWVKRGILLGFKLGEIADYSINDSFRFFDKHIWPLRQLSEAHGVRVVPGGTSIRDGAHVGRGVVIMPPAYVNVGAFVDEGTMIDSHALVGSCAQVGQRCHISAGAQIGGVLEPVGALPVIIEDDVLVGGNCGIYEGTIVRQRAILASGVILTGSTPVYDVARKQVYRKQDDVPLEIPEAAVVVPGARPITSGAGKEWALSVSTPIIVKYRDEKTELSAKLEDLLR
jgi:2,3,4,5-tetrahydropyridine-2-carboxylate N-succinyltransferase